METELLLQLEAMVNRTDKKHEVFEPSFDRKECRTIEFTQQKLLYIHLNPCRYETILAKLSEDYVHSSAKCYYTGEQGIYPVTSYMEMQDVDLAHAASLKTAMSCHAAWAWSRDIAGKGYTNSQFRLVSNGAGIWYNF